MQSELSAQKLFRHSMAFRILALVSLLFFFACAVLAFNATPENGGGLAWPAVGLFLFGMLSSLYLWSLLSTIRIDAEGITRYRLGMTDYLPWRDIERVIHRPVISSMILCAGTRRLRIHRQIRGFINLYDAVRASVPTGALEPPFTIPFQFNALWNLRLVFGGMSIFFLSFTMYGLISKSEWESIALMIAFFVISIAMLMWQAVLHYDFDLSGLQLTYMCRKIIYSAADLESIILVQRDLDIVLALQFGNKTVELSDNQIAAAPERVYESLIKAYQLQESKGSDTQDIEN